MVLSLAEQLSALRTNTVQSAQSDAGGLKQRPSLLFSPSEAADLDADAIHSIGLSGLAELEKHDPSFHKFEKLLFSRTAADFRRESQSFEVLKSLNQSIRSLLKALTPYFLLRPSLKVLEFLIRTYSVQEHNVDDLLMCTLPYHSTPQFVRLVHLIEPKGRWLFLNGVKKTGAPLSRTVLASCCASDRAVLTFVCDLAKESGAPRVTLGLFVGTCVELLMTIRKVPEDMMLAIFPVLLEGLRSPNANDLQASAYMVLAALVNKATLSPEVLKTVLEIIPKYANREAPLPSLLMLVSVCHYQRPSALSEPALQAVLKMRDLAAMLAQIASKVDARHFAALLAPALVRKAPTDKKSLTDLRQIVAEVPLDARLVELIAVEVTRVCYKLQSSKDRSMSSPREHPGVQQLGKVLCEIGNRYPEQMDAFISGRLSLSSKGGSGAEAHDGGDSDESADSSEEDEDGSAAKYKGAQCEWLMRFLSKTFHGTRHCPVEEGGTTLLLALEHPAQAVRLAALQRLSKSINIDAPPAFLADALLRRIEHDEAAVALVALSWEHLVSVVPGEALVRALCATAAGQGELLYKATPSESAAVQEQALRVLATSVLERHAEYANRVAQALLRHMLVYAKSRRRNTMALKLAAKTSHALFAGLGEILSQWKASRSEAAAESSTPRGKDKDKDKGKSKTPSKQTAKAPETADKTGSLWELNLRVAAVLSHNIVRAGMEQRTQLLALLVASGARLLQALVLKKTVEELEGDEQVRAAESLCAVLEAGAAQTSKAMAVDEAGDEAELTAQALEKLFPSELVTDATVWHRLHLMLWRNVLSHLKAFKIPLDFAGQPVPASGGKHDSEATQKRHREVRLLRRLFMAFTSASSIANYAPHIKELLSRLGPEAAHLFLTWFVRDAQRAGEHTRAHALYIGASMLRGRIGNATGRTEALGRVAQALPSVLAALHDERALVRHAAVTWLRAAAGLGKEDGGKVAWGKEPLLGVVAAGDLVQFLSAIASFGDELLSDAAHLPVFFGRALSLESMDTEGDGEGKGGGPQLSDRSKVRMQELLIRQTLQLRDEDLMAQVHLLESLQRTVRPSVVLPLAQDLLASLAAHALSDHEESAEGAPQAGSAGPRALKMRLVRIAVRLSYGRGADDAVAAAGKKAQVMMAPLLDSIHAEAQDAATLQERRAHAGAQGNDDAGAKGAGAGKDRTSRGVWLEALVKSVSASLFQALDDKVKNQLFEDLCGIAGQSNLPKVCKAARDRLRRLPLPVALLDKLFTALSEQLRTANGAEPKAGKRGKTKADAGDSGSDRAGARQAVAKGVIVLDALQAHEDPEHLLDLMPRLFTLLAAVNESSSETLGAEDGDESLAQSVLGSILALLQTSRGRGGGKAGKKAAADEAVDMQALVVCIRSAVSPQTRHEALNCLIELARTQPKNVLKHVMTVFVFLSESGLVHDDQYSFHVIEHTIKSIVPPLVDNGMEPLVLLRVFVNALPSIPAHRRMRLFTTLLALFHEDNILHIFLTLLLAKVGAPAKGGSAGAAAQEAISFGVTICGQFALEKQLSTMMIVLETIEGMPTSAKALKGCEHTAYAAAAGSVEQVQVLQERLVQVINGMLGGRTFAGLLQALPAQEEEAAQEMLLRLFERVLVQQQRISEDLQEANVDLVLTAMDAKSVAEAPLVAQLGRRLDEAQQLVGRHLSVSGFVGTIHKLLARKDAYVQQRALQCLIHKLQLLDSGLPVELQAQILSLMPLLGKLVSSGGSSSARGKASSAKDEKRSALVVQLCLCSIEHLTRLFGMHARNQDTLDAVVGAVVAALQHDSSSVTTTACSCAAAMVWHSSSMMINHINDIVPGLVASLDRALGSVAALGSQRAGKARKQAQAVELDDDGLLQVQGAILAMDRVVSKIPMLVTPQVGKMLSLLLHPSVVGDESNRDVRAAAEQARQNIVSLVAPRVTVPALERSCRESLGLSSGKPMVEASAVALMGLVEFVCARLADKDVSLYYMQLFRLLLEALDVRYAALSPAARRDGRGGAAGCTGEALDSVRGVETAVLRALEALVLKLNENRFKPLLLKMVDWANAREDSAAMLLAEGGKGKGKGGKGGKEALSAEESEQQLRVMCRFLVLCRVIEVLGQRLKAIMVPYFSYVMGFLIAVVSSRAALFYPLPRLFSPPSAAPSDTSAKKRSRPDSDQAVLDPGAALGEECVEWAVSALHKCFLFDSLGFMTKERFEAVHGPLINLLADAYDSEGFSKRVEDYLKPAIVQLAVAVQGSTGSTMLWKPLNHQLLMHTRHDSATVRFAALQVTLALVERLGDEYLTLVPETLPFVVEVLEDMDEEVEGAARSLVAALETLLGESLNEYLTQ